MAVVQADVVNIAPELAGLTPSEFSTAIAVAAARLNLTTWGVFYDEGTKWLAAHLLSVVHPDLTKSDRTPSYEKVAAAGAYNDSRFGLQFWLLQKRVVGPLVFAI